MIQNNSNFEFYEIEIHKKLKKTYESTKPNNICSQNNNFKRRISSLEDSASGEQVGDIEKILSKTCSKYNYITWNW